MTDRGTLPTPASSPDKPRFAVRISRGLVLSWHGVPLTTWEQADEARQAILDYTGEDGEVEEVVLHV